jgi:hypothetical protein
MAYENDPLTEKIIGFAINVHRALVQAYWNRLTKSVFAMKSTRVASRFAAKCRLR